MAHEVRPYRVASPSAVEFGTWVRPDLELELPEFLEGWDADSDIVIERTVRCDVAGLSAELGIGAEVGFVLTVSWVNQQSGMAEQGYRDRLRNEQIVHITMPGGRLGGAVTVRTTVTVATTDSARPLGCPRWAGSIVAEHAQRLVLEGEGAMFPVSMIDFSHTAFGPDASWALQIEPDLAAPFLGALLLLVNTRDTELCEAFSAPKRSARQALLLDHLEGEVASLLMATASDLKSQIALEEWPRDSLGEVLAAYLSHESLAGVSGSAHGFDRAAEMSKIDSSVREQGFGRRFE